MSAESRFARDVEFNRLRDGASEVNLANLLLEFAGDAFPALDREACSRELGQLAEECRQQVALEFPTSLLTDDSNEARDPDSRESRAKLSKLCLYFREALGFVGNTEDYYHPDNSYLNRVLERRTGIPISLAILFRELAAACGTPLDGVCAPGHFVLRDRSDEPIYVDAFAAEVLSTAEFRAKLERLTQEPLNKDPIWRDDVFRPATHLEIAARVLRNLKGVYARLERWEPALQVQRRLAALLPELSDEKRDLALLLVRVGQPWPALEILEPYVKDRPQEAKSLAPFLRAARRMAVQNN